MLNLFYDAAVFSAAGVAGSDWDFKNDTFHNQWQAYRTRKDPKIDLSTSHEYKDPGTYQIVVKVIDILGNDTTKTLEVKV